MREIKDLYNLFDPTLDEKAARFIIYSETPGNRLSYVCSFIFRQLNVNYTITGKLKAFNNSTDHRINYSSREIENSFWVVPQGLLAEKEIPDAKPELTHRDNMPCIYPSNETNAFPFDIFSAVFFFIARVEEWQKFKPDSHGRFESAESFLYKHRFHLKPLVDHWIIEFKTRLQDYFPSVTIPENKFRVISTIDVDNLYAFKSKGIVRTLGAALKDLVKWDLVSLGDRVRVKAGQKKDPFDIYEEVDNFCDRLNIPLFYFFLFSTGTKFDRTVSPQAPAFKKIFASLENKKAFFGIHPSYYSSDNEKILEEEIKNFAARSGVSVKLSRQHYLRFNIIQTPRWLLKQGIAADFSMGFASMPGFRAGTSFPFYYYDFIAEKPTQLLFVPFCAMDGAYTVYKNTGAESIGRAHV